MRPQALPSVGCIPLLIAYVCVAMLPTSRALGAGSENSAADRAPAERTTSDKGPDIEELFNADEAKEGPAPTEKPPQAAKPDQTDTQPAGQTKSGKLNKLSDLSGLSPFNDIAVIQRRFLPKTGRYEFFGGGSTILNDAFFINLGVNLRLGYYFRERWGVEFVGTLLSTAARDVTKGLENRNVTTSSLVSPATYVGLDAKWTPIYGKMTMLNKKIVPFDLYFSGGLGMTGTNQGSGAPSLHLGSGQIFALSKSLALRWDLSWYAYATTSSTDSARGTAVYNNVFMTVGASYFFPEATYR